MLIRKGAEASIFLQKWHGRTVVVKIRFPKPYRVDRLDSSIRMARVSREANILHDSKRAGVPTPTVYHVDMTACSIVMEYLDIPRLKEALPTMNLTDLKRTCSTLGAHIGRLHSNGIVHGDLTTSNMLLQEDGKLFFVDFGLSDYSSEVEARGVDLLLTSRAFKSTHFALHSKAFEEIVNGYRRIVGRKATESVLRKMHEIETRGRYSDRTQSLVPNV